VGREGRTKVVPRDKFIKSCHGGGVQGETRIGFLDEKGHVISYFFNLGRGGKEGHIEKSGWSEGGKIRGMG